MARPKPLVLTILDGWGYSPAVEGNAILAARKPTYDMLMREYPNALVHTAGPYVGLPEGQMGNSEVGHLNIGAGRVLQMEVTRIDLMIATGEINENPQLMASMRHARPRRLHIMGLVSDGGVHSMNTHLYALLRMAKLQGVADVCVHAFLDGRDTPPDSGAGFVEALQKEIRNIGVGRIATVSGRYYAMDRDQRWERVEKAYSAMVSGAGHKITSPAGAVKRSYEKGVSDEFIEPCTVVDDKQQPVGLIREEDAILFFNYRSDRGREMTQKLLESNLHLHVTTMTEYDKKFGVPTVLTRELPGNILGNIMAQENWRNLRVAETEKYAHVTYFFNGGAEKAFPGEEREMVASPKVATYDLKPEMSAQGVKDIALKAIHHGDFDVIVMNFANADMVGHSGKMDPTVKAVEAVDACLGEIYNAIRAKGGGWIVTADHGNAELMIDPITKGPHTYHTTNPVPFILINCEKPRLRPTGALQDIAPTILGVLGVDKPKEMRGVDLRTL